MKHNIPGLPSSFNETDQPKKNCLELLALHQWKYQLLSDFLFPKQDTSVIFQDILDMDPDEQGIQINTILVSPQKHMLWYSLEAPHSGASNEYPQHIFGEMRTILLPLFGWKSSLSGDKGIRWIYRYAQVSMKLYRAILFLILHACVFSLQLE